MDMKVVMDWLDQIDSVIWGAPMLILLMGTGLLLTLRLDLLQITRLPMALKLIFTAPNEGEGDVTSFKSLCTALAATVGTGNIVGVATAIAAGGPGAMFWMWLAAFLGIATKYAEGLLSIKYRITDDKGEISGGPMRYIELGMGTKFTPLAKLFAFFGASAGILGIGTTTQANSVIDACNSSFGISRELCAAILTLLVAVTILGGLKSIAVVSSKVVPLMAVLYFIFGSGIILYHIDRVPAIFDLILASAFTGQAAIGGFGGAAFANAIRNGVARGIFSNEAGLGSAPIASAAATTKWPAEQGLISMTGTFLDTIVICSITGLSLLLTGAWTGTLRGAQMTQAAWADVYPLSGSYIMTICLVLFASTTILGWAYYGERCMSYLFGVKSTLPYRIGWVIVVGIGPFLPLDVVWLVADITNGLMAFPNLIALIALSGVVVSETHAYFKHVNDLKISGGNSGTRG
ncbi:MAG: sodium:alanine symporter family protein [Planctomycetota bacterium]|jgi:AGCS family alanine or glycine:cation symporter|nr:sodium:alanine symporter family protein [Planctomycetota bacterium]